jgi:hypothetical protein
MLFTESHMGEFKSWNAFGLFSREITRQRRYVRTPESEKFLSAVASTCKARLRPIPAGQTFWRAQLGNEWRRREEHGFEEAAPFGPERMKPLNDRASEGRANPKGIPCLYLSTTASAALSEVRPWIGALVSLAQFKVVRQLIVVDCSVLHDQYFNLAFLNRKFDEPIPQEKFDEIVWAAIDRAFAEPTTKSDDIADYAATQTLTELFKSEGYDGIAYKSAFGHDGYSLALFDLTSAKQINGSLYEAKAIEFKFEEVGNPYFTADS